MNYSFRITNEGIFLFDHLTVITVDRLSSTNNTWKQKIADFPKFERNRIQIIRVGSLQPPQKLIQNHMLSTLYKTMSTALWEPKGPFTLSMITIKIIIMLTILASTPKLDNVLFIISTHCRFKCSSFCSSQHSGKQKYVLCWQLLRVGCLTVAKCIANYSVHYYGIHLIHSLVCIYQLLYVMKRQVMAMKWPQQLSNEII